MFDNIPKELFPIISDYAKILIPSFITYLVTRYTLSRPRKYEIREKQFTLVYLPLYLLSKQLLTGDKLKTNMDLYLRKVDKIIYKNYQYVFPKTIKLFDKLKYEWQKGNHNLYHVSNFEYQIDSDYEKLKRELGYPTNSIFDFFKRLSLLNKIQYTVLLIFLISLFYCISSAFLLFLSGDVINTISYFGTACLLCFGIYILTYPMRH